MSSWANRSIPRRRDLTQIPEQYRPVMIGRAEQPLVIQSESYQPPRPVFGQSEVTAQEEYNPTVLPWFRPQNEVIFPFQGQRTNPSTTGTTATTSTTKLSANFLPVIQRTSSNAIELSINGNSYVFVILRNLRTVKDNELWITAYNSIRRYYTNKVVIIDDHSEINTVNGRLDNTEIIKSEFNGAGEILPYYYFLKEKWADCMIFMHDSMFLRRPLNMDELAIDGARFLWYFEDHTSDFTSKIKTYISILQDRESLAAFFSSNTEWKGCFGGASIIHRQVVEDLNAHYGLFTQLPMLIRTRADRQAFERLLGIVLFADKWINNETDCSLFGAILKYPGAFEESGTVHTVEGVLSQKGYTSAIAKVWRGR